ncbi:MAG: GspH/FimT family pseudopilin [Rhodoferax sp.]|nr:GspH/FimT family pseudopilin [Rhodoferax sp.]MCF8212061.1 GspH/FimT family pseudopilin [Rhodoferax sp.]
MRLAASGFTLIELMVVVALAAIMASLAAPSFSNFVNGQRVKAAASDFAMAAVFARSEAIKRNAVVTITQASSGATGWKDGWTVAAGTVPLSSQQAYSGVTLTGPAAAITYTASGRLGAAVDTMTVSGTDGSTRCVAFDLSGLPKSSKSTTGSCS